jgi:S1-C subfamily serine protease
MPPKSNFQRKYIVLLALIAGGILGFGTMLKPAKKSSPVAISEAEKVRLQRLTQRRSLDDMASYFAGIAGNAAQCLAWLDEIESTGIVLDGGRIVTAMPEKRFGRPVDIHAPGGNRTPLEPEGFSIDLSLATLRAPENSALAPAKTTLPESLRTGMWIVQVSRSPEGRHIFTPGVYSGTVSAVCGETQFQEIQTSLPFSKSMLGGGLFDADGNLVAVVSDCGGRYVAVTVESVLPAIAQANTLAAQLLHRHGLRVTTMNEQSSAYFKCSAGALVTEVWNGRPANRAGLRPGDIVVGVEDEAVRTPDDLRRLVLPAAYPSVSLKVVRYGKTLSLSLSMAGHASANADSGEAGIFLSSPRSGYVIEAVAAGSRAERAGIEAGDRLLEVNGSSLRSLSAARRLLSSKNQGPAYVVVERNGRKLGFSLQ